ncbi:MAG: hypothetical protein ACOYB3_00820 [Azonexus sp.]
MNEAQINKVLESAIGGSKTTQAAVRQATSKLLGESELKVGQKCALIDDDNVVGGYVGGAKVKKIPDGTSGQVEVELPNGTTVYALSSLVVGL